MTLRVLPVLLGLGLFAPAAMAAPTSLLDVTQRAIASSPAVRSAEAAHALESARIQESRAAFLPQLSLSGNALQLEGSSVAVFGVPSSGPQAGFGGVAGMAFAKPGEAMVLGSATLTQTVFAGFRNVSNYQASVRQTEAAALDLERARRKAALEALDALAAWKRNQANLQALDALVTKARTRLDWVEARADAGASGALDLLQAKVSLARMETQLADARRAANLSYDILSERLGGDLSGVEEVDLDWSFPSLTEAEAIATAKQMRLDRHAQAKLEEAAGYQARAAHAGYLPVVSAFGTTSQMGDRNGSLIGLQASWIPFDGLATQAAIDRANAMSAKQEADREALGRAIVQDVRQAFADWQAAKAQHALRRLEFSLAEEAHRQARSIRAEGALTLTEFTDAEMDLSQARFDLEGARLALRRSELKLAEALGWSPERLIRQEK